MTRETSPALPLKVVDQHVHALVGQHFEVVRVVIVPVAVPVVVDLAGQEGSTEFSFGDGAVFVVLFPGPSIDAASVPAARHRTAMPPSENLLITRQGASRTHCGWRSWGVSKTVVFGTPRESPPK